MFLRTAFRFLLAPTLEERDLSPSPSSLFGDWFARARRREPLDATAMTLATATTGGLPSARIVLLKGFDDRGFVFYTNYESRKAAEIEANPEAALCFHWPRDARQVRIEGSLTRVSAEESDAYFASRPRGSRIGAWASRQSRDLDSRTSLEREVDAVAKRYEGGPVPRPAFWGGYLLRPRSVEFWQGRADRLHDRFRYVRSGETWSVERLQP